MSKGNGNAGNKKPAPAEGSVTCMVVRDFGYSHDGGVTVTTYKASDEAQSIPAEAAEHGAAIKAVK